MLMSEAKAARRRRRLGDGSAAIPANVASWFKSGCRTEVPWDVLLDQAGLSRVWWAEYKAKHPTAFDAQLPSWVLGEQHD